MARDYSDSSGVSGGTSFGPDYDGSLNVAESMGTQSMRDGVAVVDGASTGSVPLGEKLLTGVVDTGRGGTGLWNRGDQNAGMATAAYSGWEQLPGDSSERGKRTTWDSQKEWIDLRADLTFSDTDCDRQQ